MRFLLLISLFGFMPPAFAQTKGDCGTIVIPTGLGVSSSADVTSMNPLLGTSQYNAEIANLMYMPLIWLNRFGQIDWQRSLASKITTPDNGKTYDVTLRPWHWSDGVAVTAADAAYTLWLIHQLGTTYAGYGQGGMPDIIKALNIVGPTEFQVVLKRAVNPIWFIYNGLSQLMPLPAHAWAHYTLDQIWQDQSSPSFYKVVDGPLKIQRLDIGLEAVMVPNPAYQGPKMHFSRLVFKFLESDGESLQGIEAGDLDMVNLPMPVWKAVQNLPGIYTVMLPPPLAWNNIALNYRNPDVAFFKDVRVRDAMQDAIDQASIVSLVDHGMGIAAYGPVPPVLTNFLSPAMRAGHYPVAYNPAQARLLLRQAGYTPGPDGVMQRDGARLSFVDFLSTGDAQLEQEAEIIQADLRRVGIEMKVREIDFNQLLALINGPPAGWQSAEFAETSGGFPSGEGLFSTGGYYNQGGYSDAKMDALIKDSVNKPGLNGLFRYEDYASAQQPVIFFETDGVAILTRKRMHGVADFINPAGDYSPEQLYCTAGRVS